MDRVTKRANFGRTEVRGGRGKGRKREREGDGNAHKGRKRWNVLIGHAEIFVCVGGGFISFLEQDALSITEF